MADRHDMEKLRQELNIEQAVLGVILQRRGKARHRPVEAGQTCLFVCRDFKYTIRVVAD